MTELKYCSFCDKGIKKLPNGEAEDRRGEGYIIISISQGKENTVTCPKCRGWGYEKVREFEVDKNSMGVGYARN